MSTMLSLQRGMARGASSVLSSNKTVFNRSFAYLPRVTEKRPQEAGPGGRCSNADLKVAVFGAGGFLGRYVCANLGNSGVLTYIGNRGDDMELRHLKLNFDLGRSRFVFYSPHDRDSAAEVIADADVVINLIGKHYETKALSNKAAFPYLTYKTNFSYEDANVTVPKMIAELCSEMQVDNLIHVSSAAASPDSESEWSRRKYEGEMAVKEAYPWATIIRPTQMFGAEDRLLNWYANAVSMFPAIPLVDDGGALTQPVWVNNVAESIVRVLDDPEMFEGKTVDCFGPQDFSYKELSEFVYDITGQEPNVVPVPKDILKAIAKVTQYQPNPMLTPSMVEMMSEDYLPRMTPEEYERQDDIFTMKDLGINALPIEKEAFNYLHRFRTGGHFILQGGYQGEKTVKPKNH